MKTAEEHLLSGHKYASVEDVLVNMSASEVIEIMKNYAREVAEDLRDRISERVDDIDNGFWYTNTIDETLIETP